MLPVITRRRFDVDTTLFGRQQRCYNVETTSCACWVRVIGKNLFHKVEYSVVKIISVTKNERDETVMNLNIFNIRFRTNIPKLAT